MQVHHAEQFINEVYPFWSFLNCHTLTLNVVAAASSDTALNENKPIE